MPVAPKRDDKRRNRATKKAEKVYTRKGDLPTKQPPVNKDWDPRVKAWYRSLKTSAQSVFYEDSDWRSAHLAGDLYQKFLDTGSVTPIKEFRALNDGLMATEGSRRKMRLEVHRQKPTDEIPEGAKTVEEYRARLKAV